MSSQAIPNSNASVRDLFPLIAPIPTTPEPSVQVPTTFRTWADAMLSRGIPIIPLLPRSKEPCTPHAAYDATSDPEVIDEWARKYDPTCNCAAVARYDGYWMLDDDIGTLAQKYKEATGQDLPKTFTVKTSRGFHYYFLHDAASRLIRYGGHENSNVIDIPGYKGEARCNNQYVVAPGSVHPSGALYEICNDAPIVAAPVQLLGWLQQKYALSESLKPESDKPKGAGKGDPGFRKLFDAVGYRPLVNRVNALDDARLHVTEFKRGDTVPCPMPHHEHSDYTPCFGSIKNAPELLHCLGKCQWTGDMVAAVYQLDGGQEKYRNMYDCARAICKEESLNFEEFFPEKPPTESEIVRPMLDEKVFYGLAGAITKKLTPCCESHPAGMLLELLISFGNLLGRSAYFQIDDTRHYTNEFMVKVGESSRSRKGTGKNRIRALMKLVDPDWVKNRCVSGIGSGQVIVHLVRDPRQIWFFNKKTGVGKFVTEDAGVPDKRLCGNLGEFQGILAVCHQADNLLSVVMRDGWDGLPLKNLVKTNPASCEEGLISLMADTTKSDLSASLSQTERNNGFANRFLWVYVYRDHYLPLGGGDMDWTAEVPQLQDAIEFGRQVGRVVMDEAARKMWCRTLYPKLEREIPGLVGAITGRASAHTLRLALLYALLDKSDHIRVEHLEAAAAVWQYCEDSAQAIFGDLLSPEQSQILDFLAVVGSATKTRLIHDCFKKNRKADLIQNDLDVLVSRRKIKSQTVDGVSSYSRVGGSKK